MSSRESEHLDDPDILAGENALDWARTHGSGARVAQHARVQRYRRQKVRRRLAASSAVVLMVALGAALWPTKPPTAVSPVSLPASIVVAVPASEVLPDGSVVELKDGTKINVAYTHDVRRVILTQGEAHFTVAKNELMPFVVVAGGIEVRAVGTAFSVELGATGVGVLVTEGRVAVEKPARSESVHPSGATSKPASGSRTLATVDAGQRILVESAASAPPTVAAVLPADQKEMLAWRVPRIELSGTALSEALTVFNRYSPVRLSLADPSLGKLELSGVLRPDNPNALLHVLTVEFGLKYDRRPDGEIVVRRL